MNLCIWGMTRTVSRCIDAASCSIMTLRDASQALPSAAVIGWIIRGIVGSTSPTSAATVSISPFVVSELITTLTSTSQLDAICKKAQVVFIARRISRSGFDLDIGAYYVDEFHHSSQFFVQHAVGLDQVSQPRSAVQRQKLRQKLPLATTARRPLMRGPCSSPPVPISLQPYQRVAGAKADWQCCAGLRHRRPYMSRRAATLRALSQ